MAENRNDGHVPTAVDDVRRVREEIARQHRGNIREHMDETNRIFEEYRAKLKLTVVAPPDSVRRGETGV